MLPFTLDHFVMQACTACGGTHLVTPASGQKRSYPTKVGKNARYKSDEGEGEGRGQDEPPNLRS